MNLLLSVDCLTIENNVMTILCFRLQNIYVFVYFFALSLMLSLINLTVHQLPWLLTAKKRSILFKNSTTRYSRFLF